MKKVTEILENGTNIIFLDEDSKLTQGIIVGNDEENSKEDLSDLNYYILIGDDKFARGEQGAYDIMIHFNEILTTYEPKEDSLSEEKLQEAIEEDLLVEEELTSLDVLTEKAKEYKCSKCEMQGNNIIAPSVTVNGQYYVMCKACGNIRVAKEALGNDGITFVLNETPERMTTPAQQLLLQDAQKSFAAIGMSPDKIFMTKEEIDAFKFKETLKHEIMAEVKNYIDSQLLSPEYNIAEEVPKNFNLESNGHLIMDLSNLEIYEEGASDFLAVYATEDGFTQVKFSNCTKEQLKEEVEKEISNKVINGLFIYEILDEIDPQDILK